MKLFLLRHGQAEPYQNDDFSRQLTEKGRQQIASVIAHIQQPELIVVSPLVRAQQSAAIVADAFQPCSRINSDTLIPDYNPSDVLSWLEGCDADVVLLVGHNPLLSRLVNWLSDKEQFINLDTGGLACLEGDIVAPDCMTLHWIR
ncbi:phosphohistidine phosphatase SixA [Gynuella sp.]|uniref:phosphohistidine phosphatase SixA n=1 Tax=Gynuella sp. TaxID=2969146 RepID=UPI003D14F4C7